MAEHRIEWNLKKLAAGNELRERVVAARSLRAKSVSRRVECPLCLETTYSFRAKEDPCGQCVEDLWAAQDVSLAAAKAAHGEGMAAVKFSKRPHDWPYPHMHTGHTHLPADSGLAPTDPYGRTETSPARAFQVAMHKMVAGMAEAHPLPPDYGSQMVPLLGTNYDNDYRTLLPKKTIAAIMELWPLVQWISATSYQEGLDEGRGLISQLTLGTLTVEQMNNQIEKQTARLREDQKKAEEGKIR